MNILSEIQKFKSLRDKAEGQIEAYEIQKKELAKKFLNLDSIILDGEKLRRNSLFNDFRVGDIKYLIANYEQLLNNEFLFTIKYDLIILYDCLSQ